MLRAKQACDKFCNPEALLAAVHESESGTHSPFVALQRFGLLSEALLSRRHVTGSRTPDAERKLDRAETRPASQSLLPITSKGAMLTDRRPRPLSCAGGSVRGDQPMKIIAKFTNSDGKVTTATFDRATGTVVSDDGRKGTYKREGNVLKISGDQSVTLTIQGNVPDPPTAGFTAPYTSSIGTTGTMTIVSVG